jgi:A/G-specific adenine glycosylase
VSEIMLQQTQVNTVIPYFLRFMERFPDIASLASAPADEVMRHWAGLGYYARARNLQRAAQQLMTDHGGEFPQDIGAVQALPGIGRSTAGAILAQACGQRHAILDGNVRRLLSRYHAEPGWPGEPKVAARLWRHAEAQLPRTRLADYTQAVMDLGATVCGRRPDCERCPLRQDCAAHARGEQALYPQPRPQREQPLRATRMLLLERGPGEVLLQRRPPSGIWGGLWCLPEVTEGAAVTEYCELQLGLQVQEGQTLAGIRHGFTHFDLDIQPVRARVLRGTAVMEAGDHVWYKLAHPEDRSLALPAPVQRLLGRYCTQPGNQYRKESA